MKPFKTCKYVKIDGFKLPIKHEVWNGDMRWLELLVRSLCTLSRLAPLYDGQGRWLCVGKADSIPPPGECKCFFVLGSTAAKKLSSSRVTPLRGLAHRNQLNHHALHMTDRTGGFALARRTRFHLPAVATPCVLYASACEQHSQVVKSRPAGLGSSKQAQPRRFAYRE